MNDKAKTEEATGKTDNSVTIKLTKEIIAHGEPVKELKFREPTAFDIETVGMPVRIDVVDGKPRATFEEMKMSAMMVELAAVPLSAIRMMATKDWTNAAYMLSGFFLPDAENL